MSRAESAPLQVRPVEPGDAPALADLINAIIARGGTTAFEEPFTPGHLADAYLFGPHMHSAVVALDGDRYEGFQILGLFGDPMPEGWGDIGTFARVEGNRKGVGTALFAATCANARARGLTAINATIRGDNAGGLSFYGRMGFEDYAVDRAVPLKDGTPVDRVRKRFWLGGER